MWLCCWQYLELSINSIRCYFQVHSKLRNGGAKGRASRLSSTTATTTPTTPTSSTSSSNGTNSATAGLPTLAPSASVLNSIANMAKQQLEAKRKLSSDDAGSNSNDGVSGSSGGSGSTVVNPVTGLNVQILPKKTKTTSPCAISPVLLECPEQFCNKKYKHANGLRYHQSHAHGGGSVLAGAEDELSLPQIESPKQESGTSCVDASNDNNGGGPVIEMKEEKKSGITSMDAMDSRSNSGSLNTTSATTAGGVLRFGQPTATEEGDDDATMDSQKSGSGGGESGRQKKGRKSPGAPDQGGTGTSNQLMEAMSGGGGGGPQTNRAEDVKSPAYSDISDDSTPVAESEANRK